MRSSLNLPRLAAPASAERRRRQNCSTRNCPLPASASASQQQPQPQRGLPQQAAAARGADRVRTSFAGGPDARAELATASRRQQGSGAKSFETSKLMMSFTARCSLPYGDSLCIVGSCEELSEWDLNRALPCEWHDGDLWRIQVALPEREVIRYKFVVRRSDGTFQWQPGEDSTTLASASAAAVSESLNDALRFDVIRVNCKLDFGEDLFVVGSHANLGAWDPARGVQMTWTDGDVWQASVALPRNEEVEFKLVRRLKDGSFVFSEGYNRTLPPITKFELPSSIQSVPITRHVHHQDGSWYVPWYWASELGRADALVTLVDPAAMAMTVEDGINAALDVAALVEARSAHFDGLRTGGGRPAADIAAETLEAFKALQKRVDSKAVAATGVVGGGAAAGAAALKVGIGATAGIGAFGEALGMAAQPVMEVAVIGTILALGAKNLLFAEDRKKFMAAMENRDSLLALLRDNIASTGILPEASGPSEAFDPLGLGFGGFAGGGEEKEKAKAPAKLSIGRELGGGGAGKGKGAPPQEGPGKN